MSKSTKSMIEDFAENKYFIGVVMITMNIGARFLIDELTPEQKKVLNSQNFRRFIVFCAFFGVSFFDQFWECFWSFLGPKIDQKRDP